MSTRAVIFTLLVAACSPPVGSTIPAHSVGVGTVASPIVETAPLATAPAIPKMPEPTPPSTHGFWWDHDTPGRAHVFGRYVYTPGAAPVVEADGGVRVRLVLFDDYASPGAVFVRVHGQAHLESLDGDGATYVMDVPSDGFETVYRPDDVRGLEEVHAAMIDIALQALRRNPKKPHVIAIEQAAAVIDERLEGHCDAVARCRDELDLAARIRAGTVDLRTLPAVLKSYRDDPLSIRP